MGIPKTLTPPSNCVSINLDRKDKVRAGDTYQNEQFPRELKEILNKKWVSGRMHILRQQLNRNSAVWNLLVLVEYKR